MYILAFETSCDDTSVALIENDKLIHMSTRTQLEHSATGWVVPEVAARSHANAIFPCIEDVLRESWIKITDIDYIACTDKPWLLPSLLTGMTVAKTLAISITKPIIWIDHIEAHIFANFLGREANDIVFPCVVLTVSWWHTEIYLWKSFDELQIIWQTRDDAAWEAFDKVSKMMWLWFPGWAIVSNLASLYSWTKSHKRLFPEVLLDAQSLDFSFSGIKTAVKREIDAEISKNWTLSDEFKQYIAYEFEEIVTDILSKKLLRALDATWASMMILAWWVSANSRLKQKIQNIADKKQKKFIYPIKNIFSMDNAAMIGIRAYYKLKNSHF